MTSIKFKPQSSELKSIPTTFELDPQTVQILGIPLLDKTPVNELFIDVDYNV